MAKLPSVISGLMWPPDAGSAAKIKSERFTPARMPPISGRRKGDVILPSNIRREGHIYIYIRIAGNTALLLSAQRDGSSAGNEHVQSGHWFHHHY